MSKIDVSVLAGLIVIAVLILYGSARHSIDCKARGGVSIRGDTGLVCVKRDAVIEVAP